MIKFLFMNALSIVNKIDLLQAHICDLDPDILAFTESWAHEEITNEEPKIKVYELKIKGYELIGRRDQKDTLKG